MEVERSLNQPVYQKLKQVARSRSLISYSEIVPLVGSGISSPRDPRLARILRNICSFEVEHGRPMLGAVVVRRADSRPGKGFIIGAIRLGVFHGDDELAFWNAELNRVYQYWSEN